MVVHCGAIEPLHVISSKEWTSGLGFTVKDHWRPWMVNDQVTL